jgi:ATP-dependent RNA helicase RhlE
MDFYEILNASESIAKKDKTYVFSATFQKILRNWQCGILHKPVQVEATPENTTVDAIKKSISCAKEKNRINH